MLTASRRSALPRPVDLLKLTRPRQWPKNVLVFAAPAAAGVLTDGGTLLRCIAAVALFVAVSASVYCFNDVVDRVEDREHPRKRCRPVASGAVSVRAATVLAIVLLVLGLGLSVLVTWKLTVVLGVYLASQFGYSMGLKREPVVELVLVASGFVLRMIAGGVAADVPLSSWFLAVAGGGALLVVTGKRLAELMQLGDQAASHRQVLDDYTLVFLQLVVGICGAIVIVVYALWAFEEVQDLNRFGSLIVQLSSVPFLIAILRYVLEAERGASGAPEEVLVQHRSLQVTGAAWLVMLLAGVSLG